MKDYEVIFCATTLYRSEQETRYRLACELITEARNHRYAFVILDSSPLPEIAREFERRGAVVQRAGRTLPFPTQRRLLFHLVKRYGASLNAGRIFILWTEPEKTDIVNHIETLIAPLVNDEADVVIMGRTAKSEATHSRFQMISEETAKYVFQEVTGINAQPMTGPVMFTSELISYYENCNPKKYDPSLGHGYIQQVASIEAHAYGKRVIGVDVDFMYPPAQRQEEETALSKEIFAKRLEQQGDLIKSFMIVARVHGLWKLSLGQR